MIKYPWSELPTFSGTRLPTKYFDFLICSVNFHKQGECFAAHVVAAELTEWLTVQVANKVVFTVV